jgi:hypothetical protein
MKKMAAWIGLLALSLALTGTAWSSAATVEVRAGYFFPASRDLRDVYKNGLTFGAEITVPAWKSLCAWVGLDYFGRNGKLTYTQETTTIRVIPFFAGLKLQSMSSSVRPYAAVAAGYFLFKETNIIGTVSGQKIGFLAQLGLLVKIKGPVSLDIHGRYASSKYKSEGPEPFTTELGGFQGGLGVAFRL